MAKMQESYQKNPFSTEQPLEQVHNNNENNVFANERQHSENNTAECAGERVVLANLIANLTLDTESQLEGYLKEKTKVISDLKVKEEKDIDMMVEMDKQLKFLSEIVYTRNQSIQTIHMLAPKCLTYNGRPTFANPREETTTLANESRSKLNKDYVKPYDYTRQNSLYEIFKAPSLEYLYQLERAKEVRKTMWRKPFVRNTTKHVLKTLSFLHFFEIH
ncbi:hypothetical protein Tco_0613552 [Tanacetum coccineum]